MEPIGNPVYTLESRSRRYARGITGVASPWPHDERDLTHNAPRARSPLRLGGGDASRGFAGGGPGGPLRRGTHRRRRSLLRKLEVFRRKQRRRDLEDHPSTLRRIRREVHEGAQVRRGLRRRRRRVHRVRALAPDLSCRGQ